MSQSIGTDAISWKYYVNRLISVGTSGKGRRGRMMVVNDDGDDGDERASEEGLKGNRHRCRVFLVPLFGG